MTLVELSRTVLHAVRSAVADGELDVAVPPRVVVGPPGPGGCGDYATNVALQLARPAGRAPLDVAEILRLRIRETAGVADVEITGPGFLNIRLERAAATAATAALVREILDRRGGGTPGAPGDLSASGIHDIAGAPGISRTRSTSGTHSTTSTFGTSSTSSTPHPPYGHTTTLNGHVIPLRIPYDMRAEVVADALVRIIATQGGRVEVAHARPGERVDLRPVPAAEDPAPLGPDAARWALLYPASRDRPRITADHLLQRESNPLFRVRYAHARTRALGRNAARLGFDAIPGDVPDAGAVVRALAEYPDVLAQAGAQRAPDRLARHLVVLADALLAVQHTVLPLGDEKPSAAHRARLALAEAVGTVLAGGLSLLGISAPEHL
ncbi:ArgS-related anticodon-binding protein NrtL [Streptomyces nodosus]|uniref:arginine--tRNA ligase n=1 Tax=Streptomyces nodosus TaxID=40318 RepID=A0A0B5DPV4_9ACTN|nr:arginine--tRNA ligase [Streptomyces nodosus]AJE42521.1 arginyl-tRNA synthetase [Streptomyces nodosus]MBB4793841.1 arginyl-tRNA synthetase [Streptomyces nodosus]QEV41031.1 arginine--tRNA ligase [Streptomyces nodosus]